MAIQNNNEFQHLLDLVWFRINETKPILYFYKGSNLLCSLTYSDLWKWATAWKSLILETTQDDKIIISLPTGPDFIGAFLGTLMAGKIPVPIVSKDLATQQDYQAFLNQVFQKTGSTTLLNEPFKYRIDSDHIQKQKLIFDVQKQVHDIALIQFSSGSTSEPKGLLLTHKALICNLRQISSELTIQKTDKLATWLPFYHDMGLIGAFLAPIYTNTTATYHSPVDFVQDPLEWIRFVAEKKCTALVGPDFMYQMLAKKEHLLKTKIDLSAVRVCMSGAEPVKYETCKSFTEKYSKHGLNPNVMMPVYGMAESCLGVSFTKMNQPLIKIHIDRKAYQNSEVIITNNPDDLTLVSCGQALNGIEICIKNDDHILPENKIGLIWFKSPSQTIGVLNSKELSAELIQNGWIKTGDLGFIHQGELYICGREKDLIIINGKKIHAIDIERSVQNLSNQFGRCAAVMSDHFSADKEKICLCVEVKSLKVTDQKNFEKLIKEIVFKLIGSSIDIEILFVPPKTLPRTTSGKIQRYKIKTQLPKLRRQVKKWPYIQKYFLNKINNWLFLSRFMNYKPWKKDSLKNEIKMIFAEVAEKSTSEISFEKNLVDYGIDSVKMIQLAQHLEKKYGPISLPVLYSFKNLEDIYQFCKSK